MNDAALREQVAAFAAMTEEILQLAEQGDWDALSVSADRRDAILDQIIEEAGRELLSRLPDLRDTFVALLDKNTRIDTLVSSRQSELALELVPVRQQRLLKQMYRP